VRIGETPVNPYKYLRTTVARASQFGAGDYQARKNLTANNSLSWRWAVRQESFSGRDCPRPIEHQAET
jgi:hypothetical protein